MSNPGTSTASNTSITEGGLGSPAASDILKDVVAYVEVRTANDNRSSAVKRVLERMGARIEEKLSNDVTHVIFKEGKKRTRDRALKLRAHLVSVLWVDRCKELQERADESQFSANTERCGTPPPGVRWKKYKSMQPRDFADDVALSAERCQKRKKKVLVHKLLLQGRDSSTPPQYHSPSHVLVVDTQPRSALASLGFGLESPVFIPNTPPSMQARLNQLLQDKEARRRGEMEESPLCRDASEELPLQRILFGGSGPAAEGNYQNGNDDSTSVDIDHQSKTPDTKSDEADIDSGGDNADSEDSIIRPADVENKSKDASPLTSTNFQATDTESQSYDTAHVKNTNTQSRDQNSHLKSTDANTKLTNAHSLPSRRRSARLSGRFDARVLPPVLQTSQVKSLEGTVQTAMSAREQFYPAFTFPTVAEQASSDTESAASGVNNQEEGRHPSSLQTSILADKTKAGRTVKGKDHRKTLGDFLAPAVESSSSLVEKQCPQDVLQGLQDEQPTKMHSGRSLDSSVLHKQSAFISHSGFGKASEGNNSHVDSGNNSHVDSGKTGEETTSLPDFQQNLSAKHKLGNKASAGCETDTCNSVSDSASQDRCLVNTSKSASHKPAAKKRKLLNPSQEAHILSPSPTENANLTSAVVHGEVGKGKGKRKRDSCNVNAIFPTHTGNHCSSKENQKKRKKRRSSQSDPNVSKESPSETSAGRPAKSLKGSRSKSDLSDLCSTSQSSSLLGSSMSIMYNDTSSTDSSTTARHLAPPRNSIAEFKIQKPGRARARSTARQPAARKSGNKGDKQAKLMSLQKFHLTAMPSIVMTSLHRPEQEEVIAAVKKLGVFRIEDRVSKDTTHVVFGEPRRTLNVLHALARGCWLVSKEWVLRSVEEGRWVSEHDFEAVEEFAEAKEARLSREVVPPGTYQCNIFETAGSLFVSNTCTPPRAELSKLLNLCGAKVTDSIQRANFYIGDQSHDEKNSIQPVWVLDCISQQKLLPMDDYILAINFKAKSSSSPEY